MRWADCEDDEGKEEDKREQEKEKEIRQETGSRGADERETTGFLEAVRRKRTRSAGGA